MGYSIPIQIIFLLVRLAVRMPEADKVSVAGSWDDWVQHELVPSTDESGIWGVDLNLEQGLYEYRFIINDSVWIRDPGNPEYGGTHSNSLLQVGFENSPEIELLTPYPGSLISELPTRLSFRYHKGADKTAMDLERSFVRIGHLRERFRIFSDDSTRMEVDFSSLPEGETLLHAEVVSMTGYRDSLNALLLVNTRNQQPVARTERVVLAEKEAPIFLDGARSYDPDGQLLTAYQWNPLNADSRDMNLDIHSPSPRLVPGRDMTSLELTVSDGHETSDPDTVHVFTIPNNRESSLLFSIDPRNLGLETLDVSSVTVVGTWNGWRSDRDSLSKKQDGSWETRIRPGPGTHEYQYCINGNLRIANPSESIRGSNNVITSSEQWRMMPELILNRSSSEDIAGSILTPANREAILYTDTGRKLRLLPHDLVSFHLPAIGRSRLHTHILQMEPSVLYRPIHILDFRDEFGERHARNLDKIPDWSRNAVIAWLPRKTFTELTIDLSHVVSLGVNTVWIPPVLPSAMDHGYAPLDHFTIDPAMGTADELHTFVQRAHGLGMRVLLDFIANHTSDQTMRFKSSRNPEGQWHSWYRWRSDGSPHHWFHWDQLVNLNLTNATVRRHLLASASFLRGFGIDGFRLDVAWALPHHFLKQLRTESRFRSEDFLLLGEVIPREPGFHSTELDMSYDTDFYGLILDLLSGNRMVSNIPFHWSEISGRYPPESVGMTYIENHDTGRLRDRFSQEQCDVAGFMLFTWPGAPMILTSRDNEIGSLQTDLLRRLVRIRNQYPALSSPTLKWIDTGTNLLTYHRPGSIPCVIIVNPSDREYAGTIQNLPGSNGHGRLWISILSIGYPPSLNQRGSRLEIECKPWSGVILIPEPFTTSTTEG